VLTDYGFKTLSGGKKNDFVFRRQRSSKKNPHDVLPDDIKPYLENLNGQFKSVPLAFVWNADETRVGCLKKTTPPEVIVTIYTTLGSVTVPEVRDDTQLTLLTAVSVFGNWTYPLFISELKTFEETMLPTQKLEEYHDYTVWPAPRTFITAILLIGWLETIFLCVFPNSGRNSTMWPEHSRCRRTFDSCDAGRD
jgi:hypothetical protein